VPLVGVTLPRMTTARIAVASALIVAVTGAVRAADVTGKWNSTFTTQVGEQEYTFDFIVKGTSLTGTMKGNMLGESKVEDGKVDGQKFTFTENATFMEMPLRLTYACEMTSADEIKCTRTIADFGSEDLVVKRAK
jgi:hypothetical protein